MSSLEEVHNVFHVSQLRRYIQHDNHVLDHSELDLQPDLSYVEQPITILDRSIKTLKNKAIPLVLVSWNRYAPGEPPGSGKMLFENAIPNFSHPGLVTSLFLSSYLFSIEPYLSICISSLLKFGG